ncbi:MAG: hypothetical protein WAV95_18930 [Azonexus sp.]
MIIKNCFRLAPSANSSPRRAGSTLLLLLSLTAMTSTFAASQTLSPADSAAAFKAAGFKPQGKAWVACAEGRIAEVRDVNGDGLPEAIITESGSACFGNTGEGYSLVSKQANGRWQLISRNTGILEFLPGAGVGGWPDIQIGGPGFCFPVQRWNGQKYELSRFEYAGQPCQR